MYAHGHKRSNRARIRAAKFVFEQELTQTPDKFELVRRLYAEHKPVIWTRGRAYLGPVQLMRSTGKLTDAGEFLETQGWVSVARPA